MQASKIKVGHIYFVQFNPTHFGEFDKKHLAIVLKKNLDRITFVVIPMSSKADKKAIHDNSSTNKLPLGKLKCLPANLGMRIPMR